MKVEIKKFPQSEIEMLIEFDVQEWGRFVEQAVGDLSREVKIEGFRPGNAPRHLLEQKIGQGKILETAADLALRQGYIRAVKENNLDVIGRPEIRVLKTALDNPFEFKIKTAVLPAVELADYRKIVAASKPKIKEEIKVSDEEIAESLKWLQKSRAKYVTVLRSAQKGDRVEVDFTAKDAGKIIVGGESRNHPALIGEGKFVPGFEEQLIGVSENEEKKFSLVFPENYKLENLAGRLIDFEIKMKLVQEPQISELNDAFAQSVGNFADLEKLKAVLAENLRLEKEQKEKDVWRSAVLDEIVGQSKMELPQVLIQGELARMAEEFKNNTAQMGLDFGEYLKKINKTEEDLMKEWRPKAENRSRAGLALAEIARREKIDISPIEIEEEINKIIRHYPNWEAVKTQIDIDQLKEYTKNRLKNEKVFEALEGIEH